MCLQAQAFGWVHRSLLPLQSEDLIATILGALSVPQEDILKVKVRLNTWKHLPELPVKPVVSASSGEGISAEIINLIMFSLAFVNLYIGVLYTTCYNRIFETFKSLIYSAIAKLW